MSDTVPKTEPISFEEAEAQREQIKEIRKGRRQAVKDLALALGLEPETVRSFEIRDGKITVHIFVRDDEGKFIRDAGNTGNLQREQTFLFDNSDLDADAEIDRFFSGQPLEQ